MTRTRSRRIPAGVALAGAAVLATALLGCGQASLDSDMLKSDKPRNEAPTVAPDDLARQVAANTAFALELHRALSEREQGNLFFSPYSISAALAMTWAGARSDTEHAMAAALHFDLPQERLHPVFNRLDLELAKRGEGRQGRDGEGFRLRVANSTWAQEGFTFLAPFLDILAQSYGAGVHPVDFQNDADDARRKINAWVEDATEKRIEELLPQGALSPLARLVLVNAVYFNAAWASPFTREATRSASFYLQDGTSISVPTMGQTHTFPYAEGSGFQAVELPYDGDDLAMLVLVPERGGIGSFEQRLDQKRLADVIASLHPAQVDLSLPRWELHPPSFSLKQALATLGMAVAFDSTQSDFSGMDGQRDLFIHDVVHQGFVSVDEAGTEAAAATGVIIGPTAMPRTVALRVDRPFLYLIRDRPTGTVLFVGRVTDPR